MRSGGGHDADGAEKGRVAAILDKAKSRGLISHHFYGSGDELLVVDEWESEQDFQAFFAESIEIRGMMAEAGVTSEPEITFWRKLETHDDYPA